MIVGLSGQAGAGKDTVADFLVEHHGFVKIALADPIKRAAMEWWDFTEDQLWGPSEMRNKPDERYPRGWKLCCGCVVDKWHEASSGFWVENIVEYCDWPEHMKEWHRGKIITPSDDEGAIPTRVYLTPRIALQQIGTEVARRIDPDVWVRLTMRIANQLLHEHERADTYGGVVFASYIRTKGVVYLQQMPGPGREAPRGVVISDCRFKNEFGHIRAADGKLTRITRPGAGLEGEAAKHQSESEQQEVPDIFFDMLLNNSGDLHNLKLSVDSMMDRLTGRIRPFDEAQADIPPFKRV